MARGVPRQQAKNGNKITQVSWTDWTALDPYYWLEHSFQYSANINCDDELHGIKLSSKADFVSYFAKTQLISCWDEWVLALRVDALANPYMFNETTFYTGWTPTGTTQANPNATVQVCPWVVFQDYVWFGVYINGANCMMAKNIKQGSDYTSRPRDHLDTTDESIMDPTYLPWDMKWAITAMLNYNNTRLVVACWQELRVYYPELDKSNPNSPVYNPTRAEDVTNHGKTGWKKVLNYENGVTIVWLTCTFEYLKVRAVDEWRNSKVYFYQGNNNLRDTFVYNVIDLTWERVLRVYSLNGIDYYITSIDWTDWYVNLNKMIGNVPVMLFHQRAWLDPLDINFKAPYFVWPCWISAAYKSGRFYIVDAYWVFQFTQTQTSYDKGYMKRKLSDWLSITAWQKVYGLCEHKGFLYVSTETGCWKMRLYDTWKDGYQAEWVLISREFEWKEGWTVTKMLDELRLNYELNPLVNPSSYGSNTQPYWTIDVYVSPNNLWKNTFSFTESNNRYHAIHIDKVNIHSRTERIELLNKIWENWNYSFGFDWQTITYAIVIKQQTSAHATPIVRQIDLVYNCKDKTNNIYDLN
jgi:hypothetical protein